MKRHYVKVLSVASVVAGLCATNAAFAENESSTIHRTPLGAVDVQTDFNEDVPNHSDPAKNPALNPNFDLVSEVNKVDMDFMATVEARYSLYDSTRTQNFDFLNQLAIFGLHMYKNGWTADLLVRFAGNPLRSSATDANTDTYGNVNAAPVDTVGSVGIRKASIGYKVFKNTHQQLKFTLGRFAPYGQTAYDDDNIVRAWGTDATVNLWGPSGTGNIHGMYVDGAMLSWQGKWEHNRVNAEVTVASDLPVFLYLLDDAGNFNIHQNPYQVFGNDSSFGHLSTNASRAWIGNLAYMHAANWGDIQAAVDVGGKTRSESDGGAAMGLPAFSHDMYYIAASVGYTMQDKLAVGAWYNWTKVREERGGFVQAPDSAVITYVGPGVESGNYSVFGAGINGTSKAWTQKRMRGGVMTWGGGYERFMTRKGFSADFLPSGASADTDVNLYSLSAGWGRGPVTLELDWALFTAKNDIFYNKNAHVANSANVLYLVGTFDI